jgi:GDPmannose 4,6-dehydratase
MKKALITGINGQDGSYLSELLLSKGYEVHGLIRRNSTNENPAHLRHIRDQLQLHYSDLGDANNLRNIIGENEYDEIYNLAAQSHVMVSFKLPEYTTDVNALGPLRILDTIRYLDLGHKIRYYQASTSEMFGLVQETPQRESTPFYPRSPYGCAKVFAHQLTINYRESYGIHASNGILFNHESPRRGETFVTRKITRALGRIAAGSNEVIKLGNIDSKRDWGHARDYVRAMWLMLQQDKPNDYVIATGQTQSVRTFCEAACRWHGYNLVWSGRGVHEIGTDRKTGRRLIEISEEFYRPADVDFLLGDATKARKQLGWEPEMTFSDMVSDMCEHDFKLAHHERTAP